MEWFEALILGLIQGLTEYLPVSSSGHLAIGSALFGIQGEENLAFTVVVHVATVFSTMVVLWKEIEWIFKGLFKFQMNDETRYVINILISMVPVHLYLSVNGYLAEYGGCGHPFHAGLSGLRLPEVYEQVFLHRILHSVQLVVAVQFVYLFSFVPVLVPLLQQGMRLRVYSLVVDGRPVIQ